MNEIDELLNSCREDMDKAIIHLESEFNLVRAGRANIMAQSLR